MRVTRIMAAECRLALPRPIVLGPVTVTTRDFVALRLETDSGLSGDALGYPRGGPLIETIRRMAPAIAGTEIALRRQSVDRFLQRHVNNRASYLKAASLFDIALWDLAAQAARAPLFHLLGAVRETVPLMVVAGYYLDQRTHEDVCAEVERRVDQGYARIKLMILGNDPAADARLIEAAHRIAGDRLCVDAHWAWRSIPEALATCRLLDGFGLRFIEDPFAPYQSDLTAELQPHLATPLATGEDLPDAQSLIRVIRDQLFLRLDATVCGGITAAIAVAETAGLAGRSVLPHVFLPVHAQLAGALRGIDAVEHIPIESGACPMFELLRRQPAIDGGMLSIDAEPGAGFALDWDRVVQHAVDTVTVDAEI